MNHQLRACHIASLAQWDQEIAYLQTQRRVFDEANKQQPQSPQVHRARRECREELADELYLRRIFERKLEAAR